MEEQKRLLRKQFAVWLVVAIVGTGAGATAAYSIIMRMVPGQQGEPSRPAQPGSSGGEAARAGVGGWTMDVAMRYAKAFQEGDCNTVIELTEWMRERLERVRLETDDPKDLEAARQQLCRRILDRPAEGNQVREEGMEDSLIFRPGATLIPVRTDEGRTDLECPAQGRAWIRVTYGKAEEAPLGLDGLPVRSMEVGLNVSVRGAILKTSVIGNAEIDFDTIDSTWPADQGET
mgnify:CR=1 FL=1